MSRRGRYAAPDYQGTLEQGERLFERASAGFADAVHQRHLLQVGFVDQLLGRLLDRLKEQRIYDEALIIITADHGASYREGMHRRNFRKENAADIILIPLIVKVPGQESGIISDRPVETVDILPTIASVLSIDTPFGVDGQSLIDFDLPERESRTFIRRNSSRIRPTEVEDLADLAELSSKRKVDRFGTGTDKGLYSVRGTASLLGVDVSEYADPRGSDVRVRVSRPNQFKVIDLTQELWPLYVRGTVEAGGLQPVGLAVAMNGRVAATTESYMEGGEWVFATVLPEEYLRHGTNDLQVFLIDDNAGSLVLRSTFSRRRQHAVPARSGRSSRTRGDREVVLASFDSAVSEARSRHGQAVVSVGVHHLIFHSARCDRRRVLTIPAFALTQARSAEPNQTVLLRGCIVSPTRPRRFGSASSTRWASDSCSTTMTTSSA